MDNKVIYIDNSKPADINEDGDKSYGLKKKLFNLLTKRNLKLLSLIFIGIIAVVIFFGMGSEKNNHENISTTTKSQYLTTLDYCAELENKLKSVLSNIDGAGDINVMISVDGSPELVYASEDNKTMTSNSSGTTSSSNSSSPIIVNVGGTSSALILTENLPKVKGVIVVSSGAGNVAVKLNIQKAVSTLLDISSDKVNVLKGI